MGYREAYIGQEYLVSPTCVMPRVQKGAPVTPFYLCPDSAHQTSPTMHGRKVVIDHQVLGARRSLIISKMPFWQRWRRITPHLGVPVSPRPWINDPRRCPVQRLAKILIRNILANHPHILMSRVCHGIRHESDWVRERPLWRLEPDDSWRDTQHLRGGWNRFHNS